MKKIIALLLSFVMVFCLCGCEDEAEKAAREAREAQEQADKLNELYKEKQEECSDLEKAIDDYKKCDRLRWIV